MKSTPGRQPAPRAALLAALLLAPLGTAACSDAGDGPSGALRACPSSVALAAVLGTWHLDAAGSRSTLTIGDDRPLGCLRGSLRPEESADRSALVDRISFDPVSGELEFRRRGPRVQWYRTRVIEGILKGRFSSSASDPEPPTDLQAYDRHVTGWNQDVLDTDIVPRVFRLFIDGEQRAWLRVDRPPPTDPAYLVGSSGFVGRLKIYGTVSEGAHGEELEQDVEVQAWDGERLAFATHDGPSQAIRATFEGTARGRSFDGSYTLADGEGGGTFRGWRANVLSYGLAPRSAEDRTVWQERTRRQLELFYLAGNPPPSSVDIRLGRERAPRESAGLIEHRDDNPDLHPQRYTWRELDLDATLPGPGSSGPLRRRIHGVVATPTTPPPPGGYPAALLFNGHSGSAWKLMDPDDATYWYGDAYARRGFVVVAIDMSHRPTDDRQGLYNLFRNGDDPDHGNGTHPAIRAPGLDSDWEEDGERVWDATRGLDYLLDRPGVNRSRVVVSGLSMGGEITTLVGALDTRLPLVLPQGFSPDYGVIRYRGNHPCWRWNHGEIDDYIDQSDLLALIAPRGLIVTTNRKDYVFSHRGPPFAQDRQVKRRANAAWLPEDGEAAVHLHNFPQDVHHYHVGEKHKDNNPDATGIVVPIQEGPQDHNTHWSSGWQTNLGLSPTGKTLFDYIAALGDPWIMTPDELKDLARAWLAAFNDRDLPRLLALYDQEAVHTSPKLRQRQPETRGEVRGKPALQAWWKDAMERLPQLRYELQRLTASDEQVFMEYLRTHPGEEPMAIAEVLVVDGRGRIRASHVFHG